MKNKAVTTVCVILTVLAVICFGYIFINFILKDKEETNNENVNVEQNDDIEKREERSQNIILTSRIGIQLKELINYSNVYANNIIDELDTNNLSDRAKLLIALDKSFRKEQYQHFVNYSDQYQNTYITKQNMQSIINDIFYNKEITDNSSNETIIYDAVSDVYVVIQDELNRNSISYPLEVPYKITEYEDRAELLAYRLYITNNQNQGEDGVPDITSYVYYDKLQEQFAYSTKDLQLADENSQVDYLYNLIENNEIDKNSIQTVKYIFKKDQDMYKLDEFNKVEK